MLSVVVYRDVRTEKCEPPKPSETFKPDMPPPPSPASSTCSDHSGHSIVSPGPFSKYTYMRMFPKCYFDSSGTKQTGNVCQHLYVSTALLKMKVVRVAAIG